MGPRNHVLDGVQIPHGKGQIWEGENGHPIIKYRDTLATVICAKTAEPIGMPFGLWSRMGRRNHVFYGGPEVLEDAISYNWLYVNDSN